MLRIIIKYKSIYKNLEYLNILNNVLVILVFIFNLCYIVFNSLILSIFMIYFEMDKHKQLNQIINK